MTKRKSAPNYMPYPPHDALRSGIKVSWYYYRDKAKAEEAAIAARHNAEIQWSLGYDFGYCSPGSIYDGSQISEKYAGMWEVCIP